MIPKLAPRNSPRNFDAHSLQEETGAVFFSEEDATHDVDDLVMTENSNDEEKSSTSESTGENSNHNTNTAQAFFESSTSTTSYLPPPSLPSSNSQNSDDPPLSPTKAPASLPLRRPLAIVNAATPAPPISPVPQPQQLQTQQAQFRYHPQRAAQLQQPHFTLTPPVAAARPMVVAAKRHATAVRPKRPKRQRRRSRLRRQFPGNPPTSLWSDNASSSSSSCSNLMDEGGFSSSSSDSEPESLPFLPSASKKEREQQYWDMCYGSSSSKHKKQKKQNGLSTIDPQPTPSSAIMIKKLTPSWSASRKPPQKSWYVVCLPCIVCLYL